MATNSLRTVKKIESGIYREDYMFLFGRLIMKRWYVNGQRVQSQLFHEAEGLTQFNPETRRKNLETYERIHS